MFRAQSQLGPYRVLRLIRTGGEGSVYLAHDRRLNRRVALKLIPLPKQRRARNDCLFQARCIASISHPSVVQIFDVLESRRFVTLVMEYVPGTDLEQLLQSAPADLELALRTLPDICAGLAAAHRAGIVHRDLKPANVLLGVDGSIKITDFGIAGEAGTEQNVAGSTLAMSPEQAAGSALDVRSDIFAVGLMFFRMLGGGHPFADAPDRDTLLQWLQQRALPDPDTLFSERPEVHDVLRRSLAQNPDLRPESATRLRAELIGVMRTARLSRIDPLPGRVQSLARDSDSLVTETVLPHAARQGLRSHVLSLRQWGLWGFRSASGGSLVLRCSLIAMVLGLIALFCRSLWVGDPLAVQAVQPMVMGVIPPTLPPALALETAVHTALQRKGLTVITQEEHSRYPVGERLVIQIECNLYLCSAQFGRYRGKQRQVTTLALLPNAPTQVWLDSLQLGVAQSYSSPWVASARTEASSASLMGHAIPAAAASLHK